MAGSGLRIKQKGHAAPGAQPPVITSNGAGPTASINVAENTTAVTTVTATGTGTLTYSITGGTDSAKFTIGSSSGVLVFATAPNFESPTDSNTDNAYVVTVQVSDGTLTDTQTITATVTDVAEGSAGTFYVSSAGNDSNNGTTTGTPWLTMAKVQSYANSTGFLADSQVLFNGGDTFTGTLSFDNTNVVTPSAAHPFVVGSYGTGKATLSATGGSTTGRTALIYHDKLSGFTVQDLNLRVSAGSAGTVCSGVWIQNTGSTEVSDITVQRCDSMGFYSTARSDAATNGAHVFVTGYPGTGGIRRVNVLNNEMHGATTTSGDVAGIQGFGNGQNIFDVLYQGNHIYNMGTQDVVNNHASGILANSVNGGLIQFNIVHDIGSNWTGCGGPVGIWAHSSSNIIIHDNEVYHVRPGTYTAGCDWNGFGLDAGAGDVNDCIVQYNYAHDNAGSGYYTYGSTGSGNNVFRYNVGQNNNTNRLTSYGEFSFNGGSAQGIVHVYNNTFYSVGGTAQVGVIAFQGGGAGLPAAGSIIANNICITTGNQFGLAVMISGGNNTINTITWRNNTFYAASGAWRVEGWGGVEYTSLASWEAVSGETGGSTSDPSLTGTIGAAGTCMTAAGSTTGPTTCPSQYSLQTGSAAIGGGTNLTSSPYSLTVGTKDYYGHTIPHGTGTGYNRGADGRS